VLLQTIRKPTPTPVNAAVLVKIFFLLRISISIYHPNLQQKYQNSRRKTHQNQLPLIMLFYLEAALYSESTFSW